MDLTKIPIEAQPVYDLLRSLDITFREYRHPPVHTVEEANEYWGDLVGIHCKNLFLRNRRGRQHYLVVMESSKDLNVKKLNEIMGERMSFASPERLMKWLKLRPGSVSPFGLINDVGKHVHVIIDDSVMEADMVNFHPNVNTITLGIGQADFRKFLGHLGHKVTMHNFE